jgi:hypothetical protein
MRHDYSENPGETKMKLTKQDKAIMNKLGTQAISYGAADLIDRAKMQDLTRKPASAKSRNKARAFIGLAPHEVK